jgi:DNA repair exonuclease SbcCD ATPase subunit
MRREASVTSISLEEATKKCLNNNFSTVQEKNNCVEIFMKNGIKENKITFIVAMKSNERTIPFFEDLSDENKILIFKQTQGELDELSNQNIHLCRIEESQIKAKKQLESQLEQKNAEILMLKQELKERYEKISSQEQELKERDEKISSQEQELKERDEKISSQKQELGAIKSSFRAVPTPTEPKYTLSAEYIIRDGSETEVCRPSLAPVNIKKIGDSNFNSKKANCLPSLDRCVTM